MKQKRFLSRLLVFVMIIVMVLGIDVPALANEDKWYEITFLFEHSNNRWMNFNNYHGINGEYALEKGYMRINGDVIDFYLTVENIGDVTLKFENIPMEYNSNEYLITEINGIDVKHLNITHTVSISDKASGAKEIATKLSNGPSSEKAFNIYIDGTLSEVRGIVHTFSSPFTGLAVSDSGNYALSLAGHFDMALSNGTHELTNAEIAGQTIAIVARNHATGETSVIREDTIETITVTVSNGNVTNCVIRGKVQTDSGQLDYYTCTITP